MRMKIGATRTVLYSLTKSKHYEQDPADYRTFLKRTAARPDAFVAEPMSAKQAAKQLKRGAQYILVSIRVRPDSLDNPQHTSDEWKTDSDSEYNGGIQTFSGGARGPRIAQALLASTQLRSGSKHNSATAPHPNEEGSAVSIENTIATAVGGRTTGDSHAGAHPAAHDTLTTHQAHSAGDRGLPTEQPAQTDQEDKPGLIPQAKLQAQIGQICGRVS